MLADGIGFPSASAEPAPLTASEKATFNFAFAGRLGSRVYSISDRTVQITACPSATRSARRRSTASGFA